MANKFAEYKGLNLTQTNKNMLAEWEKNDISIRQSTRRKDAHNLCSMKDHHQPTDILAFTTYWLEASKILSTDTKQ